MDALTGWITGRLPSEWYDGTPEVTIDRDEALIVGALVPVEPADSPEATAAAESGRIARFREDTREQRIAIAREAEHKFGRKIAWGATCGDTREVFTTISVPVMTRLRQPERLVLDTLVDSGVARSRSHALAWCVRLVGEHSEDWLAQLRDALKSVEALREQAPKAG